jgi:hypothetical protein
MLVILIGMAQCDCCLSVGIKDCMFSIFYIEEKLKTI